MKTRFENCLKRKLAIVSNSWYFSLGLLIINWKQLLNFLNCSQSKKKSSIYLLLFNNNCWGIFEVEIISRSHIINEGIKNIGNMFHGGHIQNWYGVWMFRVMRPHQWQGIGQKVPSGGSGLFLAATGSESCSSWCTTSGQGGQSCT